MSDEFSNCANISSNDESALLDEINSLIAHVFKFNISISDADNSTRKQQPTVMLMIQEHKRRRGCIEVDICLFNNALLHFLKHVCNFSYLRSFINIFRPLLEKSLEYAQRFALYNASITNVNNIAEHRDEINKLIDEINKLIDEIDNDMREIVNKKPELEQHARGCVVTNNTTLSFQDMNSMLCKKMDFLEDNIAIAILSLLNVSNSLQMCMRKLYAIHKSLSNFSQTPTGFLDSKNLAETMQLEEKTKIFNEKIKLLDIIMQKLTECISEVDERRLYIGTKVSVAGTLMSGDGLDEQYANISLGVGTFLLRFNELSCRTENLKQDMFNASINHSKIDIDKIEYITKDVHKTIVYANELSCLLNGYIGELRTIRGTTH